MLITPLSFRLVLAQCVCGASLSAAALAAMPAAFPGAEGFGAQTVGGRGGKVFAVTTLEDYDPKKKGAEIPGSLRAAVSAVGQRIVVFRVSGVVELKAPLVIREPRLTLAGQTAPGGGICLKDYGCTIQANDVIVRHMRFRPGDETTKENDALSVYKAQNVIVDHCSASWSVDETLSVTGESCGNVTIQWCLITESLNESVHKKGSHGYGSLIRIDGGVSFHHNLYAHHRTRCPRPGTYGSPPGILLDFRNNVIYDWISPAGYTAEDSARLNYVGNYLKPGPSTTRRNFAFRIGGPQTQMFVAKNFIEGLKIQSPDDWALIERAESGNRRSEAYPVPNVTTDPAKDAFLRVCESAGATLPGRDEVDRRVIENVRTGSGRVINSPKDVEAWPRYASANVPADTDDDGQPDEWETGHGLDPRSPIDGSGDADGDGYTNIEEFLNGTDPKTK